MTLTMAIIFNTINENKESVVEPDVKPAAVMNHCTLGGVVHFYDHSMNRFKKLRVMINEPFSDTIGLKASLVHNAWLLHHY